MQDIDKTKEQLLGELGELRSRIASMESALKIANSPESKYREMIDRVSQAVFARLMGVSVHAVQAWEQGKRTPPKIACRLMDEIAANPGRWIRWLTSRQTKQIA